MVLLSCCLGFRPTRRGSTFSLGERMWMDGFDGVNDTGVFFAASLRDHSIYLLKWKGKPNCRLSLKADTKLTESCQSSPRASSPDSAYSVDYSSAVKPTKEECSARTNLQHSGAVHMVRPRSLAERVFDIDEHLNGIESAAGAPSVVPTLRTPKPLTISKSIDALSLCHKSLEDVTSLSNC